MVVNDLPFRRTTSSSSSSLLSPPGLSLLCCNPTVDYGQDQLQVSSEFMKDTKVKDELEDHRSSVEGSLIERALLRVIHTNDLGRSRVLEKPYAVQIMLSSSTILSINPVPELGSNEYPSSEVFPSPFSSYTASRERRGGWITACLSLLLFTVSAVSESLCRRRSGGTGHRICPSHELQEESHLIVKKTDGVQELRVPSSETTIKRPKEGEDEAPSSIERTPARIQLDLSQGMVVMDGGDPSWSELKDIAYPVLIFQRASSSRNGILLTPPTSNPPTTAGSDSTSDFARHCFQSSKNPKYVLGFPTPQIQANVIRKLRAAANRKDIYDCHSLTSAVTACLSSAFVEGHSDLISEVVNGAFEYSPILAPESVLARCQPPQYHKAPSNVTERESPHATPLSKVNSGVFYIEPGVTCFNPNLETANDHQKDFGTLPSNNTSSKGELRKEGEATNNKDLLVRGFDDIYERPVPNTKNKIEVVNNRFSEHASMPNDDNTTAIDKGEDVSNPNSHVVNIEHDAPVKRRSLGSLASFDTALNVTDVAPAFNGRLDEQQSLEQSKSMTAVDQYHATKPLGSPPIDHRVTSGSFNKKSHPSKPPLPRKTSVIENSKEKMTTPPVFTCSKVNLPVTVPENPGVTQSSKDQRDLRRCPSVLDGDDPSVPILKTFGNLGLGLGAGATTLMAQRSTKGRTLPSQRSGSVKSEQTNLSYTSFFRVAPSISGLTMSSRYSKAMGVSSATSILTSRVTGIDGTTTKRRPPSSTALSTSSNRTNVVDLMHKVWRPLGSAAQEILVNEWEKRERLEREEMMMGMGDGVVEDNNNGYQDTVRADKRCGDLVQAPQAYLNLSTATPLSTGSDGLLFQSISAGKNTLLGNNGDSYITQDDLD